MQRLANSCLKPYDQRASRHLRGPNQISRASTTSHDRSRRTTSEAMGHRHTHTKSAHTTTHAPIKEQRTKETPTSLQPNRITQGINGNVDNNNVEWKCQTNSSQQHQEHASREFLSFGHHIVMIMLPHYPVDSLRRRGIGE